MMSMYLGSTATAFAGAITTTVFFLPLLTRSPRSLFELLLQGGTSRSDNVSASQVFPQKNVIRDDENANNDTSLEEGPMMLKRASVVAKLFTALLVHCRKAKNLISDSGWSGPSPLPDYKLLCALLTLLQIMAAVHSREPSIREDYLAQQRPCDDEQMAEEQVEELLTYFHFAALASSKASSAVLTKTLRPTGYKIVRQGQHRVESGHVSFSHYMAIHYEKKEVVLAIHCSGGSDGSQDFLDSTMQEIVTHAADTARHGHLIKAAQLLSDETFHLVQHLFVPNGFRILVCGHSLGAGVASLLGILWKDSPDTGRDLDLKVFAFGPPPCCSRHHSMISKPFITSVVNNNDCIPMLSSTTLGCLEQQLTTIDNRLKVWSLSPNNSSSVAESLAEIARMDPRSILQTRDLKRWWKDNCGDDLALVVEGEMCVPGKIVRIWNHTQDVTILGVNTSDCTSNAARQMLLDESMLYDHSLDAYRSNLELLVEQTANSI